MHTVALIQWAFAIARWREEESTIEGIVRIKYWRAVKSRADLHRSTEARPITPCVDTVPPCVRRGCWRTEFPQQALRCEVVVIMANVVAMATAIIELAFH